MEITVLASTHVGYSLPKEEATAFSGKAAGICYMADTIDTILNEPKEDTEKRAMGTKDRGHHSVYGHPFYSLYLTNIPKIIAMFLNNEKIYNTSEKSARYTEIVPTGREEELYQKWLKIFKKEIAKQYPDLLKRRVRLLAQENARYFISVFTPYVSMLYTVSFQQLNYIIKWAKDFIESDASDDFSMKLKEEFKEFLEAMPDLTLEGLDSSAKCRKFSLFATRKRREEFGENYSVNYLASFAQLAQAQRHRTLNYEIMLPETPSFFVPKIIRGTKYEQEWLQDMDSIKDLYPQGMMVQVNERGTIENFILKCKERLCGAAQLEIMEQTRDTLARYIEAVKDDPYLYDYLLPYSKGPRCTFPDFTCKDPCVFGPKGAYTRNI